MIRRAFWLGAGAAAGIMGYRRVCAVGRKMSGKVTVTGAARETWRFTRDVRDGMNLYSVRHQPPGPGAGAGAGPDRDPQRQLPEQLPEVKDGR